MAVKPERIAQLRERLFSSWNHVDVLAQILARTRGTRFTTDLSEWNKLVFGFKRENPDLFGDVFFDINDPWPPYSQQVEGALAVMRRSGALIIWVGGRRGIYDEMTPEIKVDLIKNQPLVLRNSNNVIERMAREIDENLAVD